MHYYKEGTTESVHDDKEVEGQIYNTEVTESAVAVDGYTPVEPTTKSITIDVEGNEIIFYYKIQDGLSYEVFYWDKDTEEQLDYKKQDDMTFGDIVTAAEEVKPFEGYNYNSVDKASITIGTDLTQNVINIYYTKRDDLSYKVRHYEKDTENELYPEETIENQIYNDEITSSTKQREIEGFEYYSATPATLKIGTNEAENIITIYYTRIGDLKYTVKYWDIETAEEIEEAKEVTGKTFGDIIESEDEIIEINGYEYDSVDKERLSIGINEAENIINIYYKKLKYDYRVKHFEKGTTHKLAEDETIEDQPYQKEIISETHKKTNIDGYVYDSAEPERLEISYNEDENEIILYYTRQTGLSYRVRYIDKDTNREIEPAKVVDEKTYGDRVETSSEIKPIRGYDYDSADKSELIIGTNESENEIKLYYTRNNNFSYTVKYYDIETMEEIKPSQTREGKSLEDRVDSSTERIEIPGYEFVSLSPEELIIQEEGNIINIYYRKRNDLSYTVHYKEQGTGRTVSPDKTVGEQTYRDTVYENAVEVPGYRMLEPTSQSIEIGLGTNEITFWYTRRNDLSYIVNYKEKGTNAPLKISKIVNNVTYGTEVQSAREIVDITGYTYDSVDKDSLTVGADVNENEITIYYTKRNDLSYIVRFLEKDTYERLRTPKTVDGVEYDSIIYTENEIEPIEGYYFHSADKDRMRIKETENILNLYYVKRTDLEYTIYYKETGSGTQLKEPKHVVGQTYGAEVRAENEIIDIPGYTYDYPDKY